jgi:perosamine synthetase
MNKKISSLIIKENSTIKEAMKSIHQGGLGIALIVNKNNALLGVVTDKNIRDALLSGKDFSFPVKKIMTKNPVIALEGTPATKLLEIILNKRVHQLPIVNKDRKVVDIVLLSELKSIPLSAPDITYKEVEIINKVLATPYLSIGPTIKEFEQKIANYIGTKYAVAVNSGTSGLHLCIRSLDIKNGDEVITTPFSFIASANCILFEGAKPIFVDINENTLCIDVSKIEEKITKKTKAILPVHIFGHPCEMDKIMEIARKHNLAVIEDACEALGAEHTSRDIFPSVKYKRKKVGSFGNVGVFSFYPNKPLTTGEGGVIVTDDEEIAKLCQSMRNQGRDENGSWLCHKRLGYNYRMPEMCAALGVAQMERIEEILKKRQKVAELYSKRLNRIEGIKIPYVAKNVKMSWFVYVIRLDSEKFSREDRNKIIKELEKMGINCRDYFPPIHLEPFYVEMFSYKRGSFPITEKISNSTIAFPFYNNLTEEEINYICDSLENIISKF